MKLDTLNSQPRIVILSTRYGRRGNQDEKPPHLSPNRWLIAVFIIVSILLAFTGCETAVEDVSSRGFVIRYGERYASPRLFEPFESQKLAFTAMFDESARYVIEDTTMRRDKNILMGFTDCGSLYNENSADFAWQWVEDHLEIYARCYANGTQVGQYLGNVGLNEKNRYEIAITGGQYVFYLNGEQKAAVGRLSVCDQPGNYILFPFFGEPVPAPHNIKVNIELLH